MVSEFLWQTFVTLLVIIDPFVVVPVFISLTRNDTKAAKEKTAKKACKIAIILLVTFAFLGDKLLDVMDISEPAFRIAGGFLLLLAAIEMVVAKNTGFRTPTGDETKEAIQKDDISVFPLAIPLLAGPGAITSTVVLMRQAETMGYLMQASVIAIVIFVLYLTYLCMRLGDRIMKVLGVTGTNVLTRVFGIIVAALAIQNIISGLTVVIRSALH